VSEAAEAAVGATAIAANATVRIRGVSKRRERRSMGVLALGNEKANWVLIDSIDRRL
jgi:hypothetical protein